MKTLLIAWIPILAIEIIAACPTLAGYKNYDFGILLSQEHPFSDGREVKRAPAKSASRRRNASSTSISIFGGWMTDNNWEEVFTPWNFEFRDSTLVGIAGSRRLWGYKNDLSLEIEGQIVRYLGDQDHWEFNVPIIVRWETFPWDDAVDTSVAFGLGPSYASEVPKEEIAMNGESQRWLAYWVLELSMGMPETDWKGIFRLHHRSGAFGIVADDGGSNVLVIGLKREF